MPAATERPLVRPVPARTAIWRGTASVVALGLAALFPFRFAAQAPKAASDLPPSPRRVVAAGPTAPNQAYSPAILVGGTLYIAGHLGPNPETGQLPPGIRDQTRHAMDGISGVLRAGGMTHENLVKCHVYLASMDDYAGMNETYRGYFPARVRVRGAVSKDSGPAGSDAQRSRDGVD